MGRVYGHLEWLDEARAAYPDIAARLPADRRNAVEQFLAAEPPDLPDGERVLAHNDLGIEHMLVDPTTWSVTGVIDRSDAALTDPARDFALVYRDLGPAGLEAATATYRPGADHALVDRAVFHARCGALEDLSYGLASRRQAHATTSLRSVAWLFSRERR